MTDSSRSALGLALHLADRATADALAERLRPELLAALTDRFGLPEGIVAELAGPDAAGLRAALNADPEEFLIAAAETGDPLVGRAVWSALNRPGSGLTERAKDNLVSVVLRAADPTDDRWFGDDGLVTVLQDEGTAPTFLLTLTCGLAELVAHSVVRLGPHLPPPVFLDGCITMAELAGGAGIASFLRGVEKIPQLADLGHPGLLDLLRQAAAATDPEGFLRERRPAGEWTDPAQVRTLLELRHGNAPSAKPDGLDWDLIRREHKRLPFGEETRRTPDHREGSRLLRLVQWEGCPADLVMESFQDVPGNTARLAAKLPFEALAEPGEAHRVFLDDVLGRGIREGWLPVDRVLTEVRPVDEVLRALPYDHEPTRKALAGLLTRLGTDPVNWLTCYARMGRSPGSSVAELIADAASTATRRKRYADWPRPREAEFPAAYPEPNRKAFLDLLQCASDEVQIAVVPYFDALAVQQLLVDGDPSPAVRDAVVAAHGVAAQVAMAAADGLSAEKLTWLLDLDEPAVDAQLFRYAGIQGAERERMLAGRLRGGGTRTVPEELLRVLAEIGVGRYRRWLVSGVESGDLGVARTILGRLRLRVPATRARLLTAVWERGGPDAVRELLARDRLPVRLRRWTERALDAPDGLERLRARLAEEESPAKLMEFLTKPPSTRPEVRLRLLLAEGIEPPWSALVAAHRAGTLPTGLLDELVRHLDCPRELLMAALGRTPQSEADWMGRALKRGTLTLEDLLTHAAPARAALDHLRRYADDRTAERGRLPVRDRAAALAQEHLATDVEAWAVCLQLFPTFAGTLPELAATARAMTRIHV
ncbi:hypothetical protein AB0I10_13495 [Streptomyces sp. NPDC050636]|uniref:hypothetical protein n=1 Tax=Streptomyces sp. NPDC050636 TaxID=3154510 RepID=UPI003414D1C5